MLRYCSSIRSKAVQGYVYIYLPTNRYNIIPLCCLRSIYLTSVKLHAPPFSLFLLILFRFLSFGEGKREFSLSSSFSFLEEEERDGYRYAASDADLGS